jgi:hypothetical protein
MDKDEKILSEIKALREVISRIIGTSELPTKERFSLEAVEKASQEFKKLSIQRGEYIAESDISKIIKNAPYMAGTFIREQFGFNNHFKRGRQYYYSKSDLQALAAELKKKNVDLNRYIELKEDQAKFDKYVASIFEEKDTKLLKRKFNLPDDAIDVTSSPPKLPDLDILRNELQKLKDEFFEKKFADYIDIYKSNYAMVKSIYYFEKYLEPSLRKRLHKWCEDFNLVNRIIFEKTKKREKFIPIPEDKMIRL